MKNITDERIKNDVKIYLKALKNDSAIVSTSHFLMIELLQQYNEKEKEIFHQLTQKELT